MRPALHMNTIPMDQCVETQEAIDRTAVMKKQEEEWYCVPPTSTPKDEVMEDLHSPTSFHLNACIDEECRMKMCEWCYQVVDCFKFSRETVYIAMSYVDRFLSTSEGRIYSRSRSSYQLAAITSLYMAIKIHEPVELDLALLVELSRNCYTVSQISDLESTILTTLEWRVNPPTPLAFLQNLHSLLPAGLDEIRKNFILDFSRHEIELSVFESSLLTTKASTIAMAALFNAIEAVGRFDPYPSSRESLLDYILHRTGMHSQATEVCRVRILLLAQLRVSDHMHKKRKVRVFNKPQSYPLRNGDGSRDLSPVSIVSR